MEAGITKFRSFETDLLEPARQVKKNHFDLIIADLPCTGSGTWSRTPEQLYFFEEKKIDSFVGLQLSIIKNIIPHLKPGGFLLYITCSVFKDENEENVKAIQEKFGLKLLELNVLKGYDKKADSLFAALLQL
jgi:16S rRNA (cytosine967-C5)-methyltransferase